MNNLEQCASAQMWQRNICWRMTSDRCNWLRWLYIYYLETETLKTFTLPR